MTTNKDTMKRSTPSIADLNKAHDTFLQNEPRYVFYNVARELVDLSLKGKTKIKLAEAISVLLKTWNRAYYAYRRFDESHFNELEEILDRWKSTIELYRKRRIHTLKKKDKEVILEIFHDFEEVLGPVGAAKTLHLLGPSFFPIWDKKIAYQYRLGLGR